MQGWPNINNPYAPWGYHNTLTSRIPFESTLGMTEIWENTKTFKSDKSILNVSIYIEPGSGQNAAYLPNCLLILVTNKSIPGL